MKIPGLAARKLPCAEKRTGFFFRVPARHGVQAPGDYSTVDGFGRGVPYCDGFGGGSALLRRLWKKKCLIATALEGEEEVPCCDGFGRRWLKAETAVSVPWRRRNGTT